MRCFPRALDCAFTTATMLTLDILKAVSGTCWEGRDVEFQFSLHWALPLCAHATTIVFGCVPRLIVGETASTNVPTHHNEMPQYAWTTYVLDPQAGCVTHTIVQLQCNAGIITNLRQLTSIYPSGQIVCPLLFRKPHIKAF